MAPRKKEEVKEVEFDEKSLAEVKIEDKPEVNKVTESMDKVTKALEKRLEDLEGIGPVRLKKLYANGIYTVDELMSQGEEWLVKTLDIPWDDARKLVQIANESLNTSDVFSSMYVSGRDYDKHIKERTVRLTTGLKEFDAILDKHGKGYESGVITEFFGAYGAGKTQVMMVACIMAQMPKDPCCLHCGQTEKLDTEKCQLVPNPDKPKEICGGTIWQGGGLSEWGKPCRVIYFDTENSYRPERLFDIVCNRELVKTKPQTITQIKEKAIKEPLNDEEYEKAMVIVDNVNVSRPRTSGLLMMYVNNLGSAVDGDFCKICHKREIDNELKPTHQNHPKAEKAKKDGIELEEHDFTRDTPVKLVVIDSLTGKFRKEFEGRGELSDRQMKLKSYIKMLENTAESKNIVLLVTNQVQEALGVMGDNIRPVGGNEIGHTITHRIYLKKPQSITKNNIDITLVDSPSMPKNTIKVELGFKGIQQLSTE